MFECLVKIKLTVKNLLVLARTTSHILFFAPCLASVKKENTISINTGSILGRHEARRTITISLTHRPVFTRIVRIECILRYLV